MNNDFIEMPFVARHRPDCPDAVRNMSVKPIDPKPDRFTAYNHPATKISGMLIWYYMVLVEQKERKPGPSKVLFMKKCLHIVVFKPGLLLALLIDKFAKRTPRQIEENFSNRCSGDLDEHEKREALDNLLRYGTF